MIRAIDPSTDDTFPPEGTMRLANWLADVLGPYARDAVAELVWLDCRHILGAGDRQELLDCFFAERAERQRQAAKIWVQRLKSQEGLGHAAY